MTGAEDVFFSRGQETAIRSTRLALCLTGATVVRPAHLPLSSFLSPSLSLLWVSTCGSQNENGQLTLLLRSRPSSSSLLSLQVLEGP